MSVGRETVDRIRQHMLRTRVVRCSLGSLQQGNSCMPMRPTSKSTCQRRMPHTCSNSVRRELNICPNRSLYSHFDLRSVGTGLKDNSCMHQTPTRKKFLRGSLHMPWRKTGRKSPEYTRRNWCRLRPIGSILEHKPHTQKSLSSNICPKHKRCTRLGLSIDRRGKLHSLWCLLE